MANPTTNFGWVMPTSSSLVTNLPADFNTFGQAVDTSMSELLGGTTGQVLSKTSNTNMDFTWVTPTDQTPLTTKGDIFAFSTVDARLPAGTNETRLVADSTQTLGLKYVADTTNYAIAAKADLLVGTAADTLAALTVGTNGQVLTADSTVSPTGLKWATPAAAALVGVQATRTNVSTSLTGGTAAAIAFNTENFDTDGFHDNTTNNSRITIPSGKGGKYLITLFANTVSVNPSYMILSLYLNGAQYTASGLREGTVFRNDGQIPVSTPTVVTLAAADYLEFYFQQSETATANMYFQFTAIYLGA